MSQYAMGLCVSTEVVFIPNDDIPGQDGVAVKVFEQLMLSTMDINKLYEAFLDMDADGSGFIRADEFRAYFKIEATRFNDKLFCSFDADSSGHLNFMEFVAALYNFLSTETVHLGRFAFYLLAHKKVMDENYITNDHLKKIIELIHGPSYVRNKGLKKEVELMLSHDRPVTNMNEFVSWCRKHPVVINPITRLQLTLRQEILGEDYWEELGQRRRQDPHMKSFSFVTEITKDAVKKYEQMAKSLEALKKEQFVKDTRTKRRGSISRIIEKARRISQRFKKNTKVAPEIRKPDHKRPRRSFIKPKIKTKHAKKAYAANIRHDLYYILFSRIIVVDDDPELGRETVRMLRTMGISTDYVQSQLASDSLLCVESSMREGNTFEVIFVNGCMPTQNGIDVAKKLRSLGYPGIIIGMCTAGDGIDQNEFLASGANAVLSRPLDPEVVRQTFTDLTPAINVLLEARANRVGPI